MGKTILTADDSASVRQTVSFTLRSAGYEVVEAVDGQDALAKFNNDTHLVITDLNMPRLDGLGLIHQIRSGAINRCVPIILLTTESQDAKKSQARAAGATGWIVKPFKPDQLVAVVKKVIR